MRLLLALLLLCPAAALAEGETCTSLVGPASARARNRVRRVAAVEKVEVDALGNRVIFTSAPLDEPGVFRPQGIELIGAADGRAVVKLGAALARACQRDRVEVLVDDALGRGVQILHVDDGGALVLKDDRLLWWGDPPPRFQMVWRSSFAVDINFGNLDLAFDFGEPGRRRSR